MAGLIGKKIGMTSIYGEGNKNFPCTVIEAGPCVITQLKTIEKDGYKAYQLAFDEKKEKNTSKGMLGHFKKTKSSPKHQIFEFDAYNFDEDKKAGDTLNVDIFQEGEFVDIVGTSKGKGFQGVVKRHGFKGTGDATHGQHNRQRHPGSIGAASYPAKVIKGMKMGGRTGGERVNVKNLKVLKIYPEKNILVVSGAVPGHKGAYVLIKK